MSSQNDLKKLIQKKEADLRELRDARPRAYCSGKNYSREDDMQRAVRIEQLEDELAELKKKLDT